MGLGFSSRFFGFLVLILSLLMSQEGYSWEDHAFLTHLLFSQDDLVARAPTVPAESIESFLKKEKKDLIPLLMREEQWAREHVPYYPARVQGLQWSGDCSDSQLKICFLKALRVNPHLKLNLFLQLLPGERKTQAKPLPWSEVTLLSQPFKSPDEQFISVREGERVSPLRVLATSSDEPDYGLDIGLWEDNSTEFAREYGFGKQPFGNPVLEFSGQAPFHMGFFHEPQAAYLLAPYLSRTYPEYRIHLFKTLSQFAFKKGHPYWGYRFAGWALHYLQDLTQPYHATAVPGGSFLKTALLGILDFIGIHGPLQKQVQLLTNEHLALENLQYFAFHDALRSRNLSPSYVQALLSEANSSSQKPYQDSDPRHLISKQSSALSHEVHQELRRGLSYRWIQDPRYLFGTTEPELNLWSELNRSPSHQGLERISQLLAGLMRNVGIHSRSFIHHILNQSK